MNATLFRVIAILYFVIVKCISRNCNFVSFFFATVSHHFNYISQNWNYFLQLRPCHSCNFFIIANFFYLTNVTSNCDYFLNATLFFCYRDLISYNYNFISHQTVFRFILQFTFEIWHIYYFWWGLFWQQLSGSFSRCLYDILPMLNVWDSGANANTHKTRPVQLVCSFTLQMKTVCSPFVAIAKLWVTSRVTSTQTQIAKLRAWHSAFIVSKLKTKPLKCLTI